MKTTKTEHIQIRCTPEQRRLIERRAREHEKTLSAYLIDVASRNGKPVANRALEAAEQALEELQRQAVVVQHPYDPQKNLRRGQLGLILNPGQLEALAEISAERHASVYDAVEQFALKLALDGAVVRSLTSDRDVVSVTPENFWRFVRTDASDDVLMELRRRILEAAGWSSSAKGENVVESKPPTSRKRRRG